MIISFTSFYIIYPFYSKSKVARLVELALICGGRGILSLQPACRQRQGAAHLSDKQRITFFVYNGKLFEYPTQLKKFNCFPRKNKNPF
jgi:hypothetical protein